jgi:hypothetical protein
MIREFAVEPEVMANWTHFRELWEDFGVSCGRLISEYPHDWRDQVCRKAYELSSTKAASIAARLKPGPGQSFAKKWIPTSRAYDRGKDWLNNAEGQKPENQFVGIVARKNPRAKSRVLVAGEFLKDQPPWKAERQRKVVRTPHELAKCVHLLLEASDEILLIDPNFDSTEPRFKDPLLAFLHRRPNKRAWRRCELHTDRPKGGDVLENRKSHVRRNLPDVVPAGTTLRVHFWDRNPDGEKLHPRFLVTELGGVQFDYGLDSGDAPNDKTIVTLLDHELWQTVRADYSVPSPTFTITPECIVSIAGRA